MRPHLLPELSSRRHAERQDDMIPLTPRGDRISRFACSAIATGSAQHGQARLRPVHRAIAELRRGTPVLLESETPLVLLPAETAGAGGLAELAALAVGQVLLLAPARAAALLRRLPPQVGPAVALPLPPLLFEPSRLRSLADPTCEEMLPEILPLPVAPPPQAEAALTLAKLARLLPAMLAAPVSTDRAQQARGRDLMAVASGDVLAYPRAAAAELVRVAEADVPLQDAPEARVVAFRAPDAGIEHLAILVGRPEQATAPLVRIHSECFTGDLLGSLRCDCGVQLRGAIRRMAEDGAGVLLYLAQEGRGIGLVNKLRAYALQDRGLDTVDANRALGWEADERLFLSAAAMLGALGLRQVRLLTNNPEKIAALAACGMAVTREPHAFAPNGVNDRYLATKAARFGHLLDTPR
jgi:GTP cyclohydrolase II